MEKKNLPRLLSRRLPDADTLLTTHPGVVDARTHSSPSRATTNGGHGTGRGREDHTVSTTHTPDTDATLTDPVSAEGINGAVSVDGALVTIRKGLVVRNSGIRGPRRIALRDVTDVRMEPATEERPGSLQVIVNGDRPDANGEHTIRFAKASSGRFEQVHARVRAALQGS